MGGNSMGKKTDDSKEFIWGQKKNKKWIYISVGSVVLVAAVLGYIIFGFKSPTDLGNNSSGNANVAQGALTRRALDGVFVSTDQANHFPVGVMIENLVVSRPQSGLAQAGLVYEALVEGGITRFLALYSGELVTIAELGPIRSARPYYLDWVSELGAMYMHAGGSPEAVVDIRSYDLFDLDQFYNPKYYYRDKDRPVAVEHTLYSSGNLIGYALRDEEAAAAGDYRAWSFKDGASLADRPSTEKNVLIDFSSFNYKVEYRYDREQNNYLRYMAGDIHQDKDGTEIRATNVVVQKVKTNLADAERLAMTTTGEGEALVFIDGIGRVAKWKKADRESRTVFYDLENNEISFNAGPTWVEVVPTDREIEYN